MKKAPASVSPILVGLLVVVAVVQMGEKADDKMEAKILNDTVAYIHRIVP